MIEHMTTAGDLLDDPVASCTPDGRERGAPLVGWATGPLGDVQAAEREIGRQTAARARAVAAFAATRPASVDRQPGQPGCASAASRAARPEVLEDVSEWAGQELSVALSITEQASRSLLTRSLTLVHRLPRVLAALEAGVVHTGHLWAFQEKVATIGDAALRAQVEGELLAWLSGRVTTPAQLADKARRLVLARDPRGAAERLARALQERGVFSSPRREDGMSALTAVLATAEARACLDVLGRLADAIVDDEPADGGPPVRTRAQKMADGLMDLVLRPGETDLPVISAQLTLVATAETMAGGDQPGELDGEPVPAEVVRALARKLGLVPDPEPQLKATPTDRPARAVPIGATAPPARPGGDAGEGGPDVSDTGEGGAGVSDTDPPGDDRPHDDLGDGQFVWRGAEALPEDLERAHWEREAAWEQWLLDSGFYDSDAPDLDAAPDHDAAPEQDGGRDHGVVVDRPTPVDSADATDGTASPGWSVADAAVQRASEAVEATRRALREATGAVTGAERSAAVDEDTWDRSAAGRISRARSTLLRSGAARSSSVLCSVTCSTAPPAAGWSTGRGSPSSMPWTAPCSPSPTLRVCAGARTADSRHVAVGSRPAPTTWPEWPGWARHRRHPATGRHCSWTASCGSGIGAAGSRAAASACASVSSTTTGRTRRGLRRPTTSPATASTTTAASTRRRAGRTCCTPTDG